MISETDLERLDKCVEENSNTDTPSQELDQTSRSEEFEEADLDELGHVDDAPHHCDEVEDVPRLTEIVLRRTK